MMTEWDNRANCVKVDPTLQEVSTIILETNKNCQPIQNEQHQDIWEAIEDVKKELNAMIEDPETSSEDIMNLRHILILLIRVEETHDESEIEGAFTLFIRQTIVQVNKVIVGERVEVRATEEEVLLELKQQYGSMFISEDETEESQRKLEELLEKLKALKTKDRVEGEESENDSLPDLTNLKDDTEVEEDEDWKSGGTFGIYQIKRVKQLGRVGDKFDKVEEIVLQRIDTVRVGDIVEALSLIHI